MGELLSSHLALSCFGPYGILQSYFLGLGVCLEAWRGFEGNRVKRSCIVS